MKRIIGHWEGPRRGLVARFLFCSLGGVKFSRCVFSSFFLESPDKVGHPKQNLEGASGRLFSKYSYSPYKLQNYGSYRHCQPNLYHVLAAFFCFAHAWQ